MTRARPSERSGAIEDARRPTLHRARPSCIHAHPELGLRGARQRRGRSADAARGGRASRSTRGLAGLPTAFAATRGHRRAPTRLLRRVRRPARRGPRLRAQHHRRRRRGRRRSASRRWPTSSALTVTRARHARRGGRRRQGRSCSSAGAFDDVHAAMMVHPWPTERLEATCLAVDHFDVTFTGTDAHASAAPWQGVNAGDAHDHRPGGHRPAAPAARARATRSTASSTEGGEAANIIPARVIGRFMAPLADHRAASRELRPRVDACFEAGALATGASARDSRARHRLLPHGAATPTCWPATAPTPRRWGGASTSTTTGAPRPTLSTDMANVSLVAALDPPAARPSRPTARSTTSPSSPRPASVPPPTRRVLDGALACA